MAIVLLTGSFFRGNAEGTIRKALEEGATYRIGLPANTLIPASQRQSSFSKRTDHRDVYFIDAS